MLDFDLFSLLRTVLTAGFIGQGQTVDVLRDYNPRTAPATTGPTVFVHKLFDQAQGSPRRQEVWNPTTLVYDSVTTQWVGTHVQAGAVWLTPPGAAMGAGDLLNLARGVLQTQPVIDALRAGGVGLLAPTDVRTVYVKNERDEFEPSLSFDFVLTHEQVITVQTPPALVADLVIIPV